MDLTYKNLSTSLKKYHKNRFTIRKDTFISAVSQNRSTIILFKMQANRENSIVRYILRSHNCLLSVKIRLPRIYFVLENLVYRIRSMLCRVLAKFYVPPFTSPWIQETNAPRRNGKQLCRNKIRFSYLFT